MKKIVIKAIACSLGILLTGTLITACGNNSSEANGGNGNKEIKEETDIKEKSEERVDKKTENIKLEEVAREFVEELIAKRLHEVKDNFDLNHNMKKIITDVLIQKQLYPSIDAFGEVIEVKEIFRENDNVFIPVVFEKQKVTFLVSFEDGKIAGFWLKDFREKEPEGDEPKNESYVEREMSKVVDGFEIKGSLTLPDNEGKYPVVILVHGSGSTDRDESVGGVKPFKDIAMGLAKRGIGTYRYDKRSFSYGAEIVQDKNFNLEGETIKDAVKMAEMLMDTKGVDASKIFVLGHSLGGYAIPRIAEDSVGVRGYILMAGASKTLHDAILEQTIYLSNLDGNITEDEQAKIDMITSEVKKIKNIDNMRDDEKIMGIWKGYWEYMENYDPVELAKEIKEPVLLIQSEDDWNVDMSHYKIWNDAFGESENWQFNLYSGLSHLMTKNDGSTRVEDGVIEDISKWIKAN